MEMQEITRLSPSEITRTLAEQREELRRLRFSAAEGSLKEVRRIRALRRTIARLETTLTRSASAVTA